MTTLGIGTRGSALALTQTGTVADDIATETGASTELVTITTAGDRSNEPLSRVGGAGLFTGALRDALLAGTPLPDTATDPARSFEIVAPIDASAAADGAVVTPADLASHPTHRRSFASPVTDLRR